MVREQFVEHLMVAIGAVSWLYTTLPHFGALRGGEAQEKGSKTTDK